MQKESNEEKVVLKSVWDSDLWAGIPKWKLKLWDIQAWFVIKLFGIKIWLCKLFNIKENNNG